MRNCKALILLVLLASCTKKLYSPSTVSDSSTEDGTIRIHATGFGKSQTDAYYNSVQNAFSMLLYKGIPESVQSTPLIPDEATAVQQHPDVMNCFKDDKCYSQFLTKATREGEKTKVKNGYESASDVTINIRSLRSFLEKNNVIRKFGF